MGVARQKSAWVRPAGGRGTGVGTPDLRGGPPTREGDARWSSQAKALRPQLPPSTTPCPRAKQEVEGPLSTRDTGLFKREKERHRRA